MLRASFMANHLDSADISLIKSFVSGLSCSPFCWEAVFPQFLCSLSIFSFFISLVFSYTLFCIWFGGRHHSHQGLQPPAPPSSLSWISSWVQVCWDGPNHLASLVRGERSLKEHTLLYLISPTEFSPLTILFGQFNLLITVIPFKIESKNKLFSPGFSGAFPQWGPE